MALTLRAPPALGGVRLRLSGGRCRETERADLHLARAPIAGAVSGRVARVAVAENHLLHGGDVVFRIDPEPCHIALSEAEMASARIEVG